VEYQCVSHTSQCEHERFAKVANYLVKTTRYDEKRDGRFAAFFAMPELLPKAP
jgi:uncharacterized protein YuzB (UPF0349 family)